MYSIVSFVFVLFVGIKPEKPYFASRPGLDSSSLLFIVSRSTRFKS